MKSKAQNRKKTVKRNYEGFSNKLLLWKTKPSSGSPSFALSSFSAILSLFNLHLEMGFFFWSRTLPKCIFFSSSRVGIQAREKSQFAIFTILVGALIPASWGTVFSSSDSWALLCSVSF